VPPLDADGAESSQGLHRASAPSVQQADRWPDYRDGGRIPAVSHLVTSPPDTAHDATSDADAARTKYSGGKEGGQAVNKGSTRNEAMLPLACGAYDQVPRQPSSETRFSGAPMPVSQFRSIQAP
jgi:hypothetical protein